MSAYSPDELCSLSAAALVAGYERRDFTPVDVLEAVLARSERLNPRYNMFFYMDEAGARAQAQASAARWAAGTPLSPLDGVPVSIKDSMAMQGAPMRVGSRAVEPKPSVADAPPTARLREAGAVLFAKTTMPDHGMFGAGVSTAFGVTRNPWNPAFNTGGSSSGAGAALAARLGPLSAGSDIAGSVRFPASLCGLCSLKPTHGLVPHLPVVSVREAGPMARTVTDVALMFEVMAGADGRDYGSVPLVAAAAPTWRELRELRIGLLLDMGYADRPEPVVEAAIRRVAQALADAGAQVEEMPPLLQTDPMPAMSLLYALPMLARFEGMSAEQRGKSYPPLLDFAESARHVTGLEFLAAQAVLEAAKTEVVRATSAYDYVLAPVLSTVNWAAERNAPHDGDIYRLTNFCGLFNQTGQPVACVPAGMDERGLPIGMQIIGQRFDDRGALQLAQHAEALRGFDLDWPSCD